MVSLVVSYPVILVSYLVSAEESVVIATSSILKVKVCAVPCRSMVS